MTVCIAAICTWCGDDIADYFKFEWLPITPEPHIIGIADRMISTGYAQSELPRPKFSNIINSIMALMAGVTKVTDEVFERTRSYVCEEFMNNQIIPVERIAGIYRQNLIHFLNNRRDEICYSYSGFKFKDFLTHQHTWDETIVNNIKEDIKNETETQTIITGIDEKGAHIYTINGHGSISCEDSFGFAAIGSGDLHATPQLMRAKHSSTSSYVDTLLLTYMAKKQAEIDPWVGKDYTDIFVITNERNFDVLPEETVKMLQKTYNDIYNKVLAKAKTKIQEHLIKEREKAIAEAKRPL